MRTSLNMSWLHEQVHMLGVPSEVGHVVRAALIMQMRDTGAQ